MPAASPRPGGHLSYSIVVLSYNQEAYVGDAVRAALAQDYTPLEIIISDDCSTDNTFGVIQDAVAGYDGPHHVTVRQNAANEGLVAHLNRISALASGDVIIPAYGDDISLPMRVSEIAKVFDSGPALLVHSDAIAIDAEGNETASNYRKADFYRNTDPLIAATSMALYLGAAGAWHRTLFEKYGPLRHPNLYDDHVLGFRAALENGVTHIEKPLLKYREGIGISHQLSREKSPPGASAARRKKILELMISTFRQRLVDAATFGLPEGHAIPRKLRRALRKAEMRRACYDGIGRMILTNLRHPLIALSAAASEGLRIIRRR